LKDFLGYAAVHCRTAEKIPNTHRHRGLAWTPFGGDVLFIEATRMRGRGNLLLTGFRWAK